MHTLRASLGAALLLSSFFLLPACGGVVAGSGNDPGGTPAPGAPDGPPGSPDDPVTGHPPPPAITGDYQLTFSTVTAAPTEGHVGPPPSQGGHARLTIVTSGAKPVALVTPYFGRPTRFDVTFGAASVTLTTADYATAQWGGTVPTEVADQYDSFTLDRSGGALTGTFVATGHSGYIAGDGDYGPSGALSARGTIVAARPTPELRTLDGSPLGPTTALLPWDAIIAAASEPTSSGLESFEITGAPSKAFKGISDPSLTDGSWILADTSLTSFEPPPGGLLRVTASISGAFESTVHIVPVGPLHTSLSLDDPSLATWGSITHLGSPLCEGAACLQLGPWKESSCDVSRHGFAARLSTIGKTALHVRYRVLAGDLARGGMTPFTLQLAAPSGERLTKGIAFETVTALAASDPGAAVPGMVAGSEWKTATFPLPSTAKEHGFALVAGHEGKSPWCHPSWPVDTAVLIGAITLE